MGVIFGCEVILVLLWLGKGAFEVNEKVRLADNNVL
jgi:hypothetical protein